MDATDSELMLLLAKGEDEALDLLMRRWSSRVLAFLCRLTGRYDVAMDLAQETFVRVYQARRRYRAGGAFGAWLFAIAANLGRNHARWQRRHPTVSLDDSVCGPDSRYPEPVDPSCAPDGAAVGHEVSSAVNQAVMGLPPDLREALVLFVFEDLGYADIASITGCSPKAVETRIYRARQILREKLAEFRSAS